MIIGIDIRNIGKKRTGDEVVFFNLVKNLALIDNENEYSLFTDISDGNILAEIKKSLGIENRNNFKIISLKSQNKFIWNIWTLPRYLRKNPADIYQTQYITPWFVPKHTKIITVIHDISFNFYSQFIKFFDLLFLKILIPLSLRRADKIVAVSKFTADEVIKYYKVEPDKVAWVHNAFSEDFLKEITQSEKEIIRKRYALPEKFILYLGTLQPRKNIPHLIEAFARIKGSLPDIKLVLCGNRQAHNFDREIDKIIKKEKLEKDVYFPGYVSDEDKKIVFGLAHIFVFPSFYEGFGIPILEAMVAKIPILASRIPSHEEIAGESILFFEINDKNDLENKLKKICLDNNLREDFIKKENEQINKFSWHKSATEFYRLYSEI